MRPLVGDGFNDRAVARKTMDRRVEGDIGIDQLGQGRTAPNFRPIASAASAALRSSAVASPDLTR